MSIFKFEDNQSIGTVYSVDTSTVVIKIEDLDKLRRLQVNHLVAIKSSKSGQFLIGIINRITRKQFEEQPEEESNELSNFILTENIIKVNLIGTILDKFGSKENVFKRTLDTVPEIDAMCFSLEGENITNFMRTISSQEEYDTPLSIGNYSIDEQAKAFLDGDKLVPIFNIYSIEDPLGAG